MNFAQEFNINCRITGSLKIAKIFPKQNDLWGVFEPLRNTPLAKIIKEVPFSIYQDATKGYTPPLLNLIGDLPSLQIKRIPLSWTTCKNKLCLLRDARCKLGTNPACFLGIEPIQLQYGVIEYFAFSIIEDRYLLAPK